jgi:hypothetical protein
MYCSEVIVKTLEYLPIDSIGNALTVNKLWHYSTLHAHLWNMVTFALPERLGELKFLLQNFINPLDFRPNLVITTQDCPIEDVLDCIRSLPKGVRSLEIVDDTETRVELVKGLLQCNLQLEEYKDPNSRRFLDLYELELLRNNSNTLQTMIVGELGIPSPFPKLETIECRHLITNNSEHLPSLKKLSCLSVNIYGSNKNWNIQHLHLKCGYSLPICPSVVANVEHLEMFLENLENISLVDFPKLKTLQLFNTLPFVGGIGMLDIQGCPKLKFLDLPVECLSSDILILLPPGTKLDTITCFETRSDSSHTECVKKQLEKYANKVIIA